MKVNRLIFTNLGVWNMFINICREAQENWFRAKDQCWNTINSHRPDAQMKTAKPCMKSQSVLNRRHLLRAGAFFFSIVVKICQIENTLQFSSGKWSGFRTVSLPDTSAAHLLGYCSHWFQSNPGGRCLSSNLHIQFPPLFLFFFCSKAGTEIALQNIEILQETNWPFPTLVRKTWAGREGSKKTLQGWMSLLEVFSHQKKCTVWTSQNNIWWQMCCN